MKNIYERAHKKNRATVEKLQSTRVGAVLWFGVDLLPV